MSLKYQTTSNNGRLLGNTLLIYDFYFITQSLTPVPTNIIPYFSEITTSNQFGIGNINFQV